MARILLSEIYEHLAGVKNILHESRNTSFNDDKIAGWGYYDVRDAIISALLTDEQISVEINVHDLITRLETTLEDPDLSVEDSESYQAAIDFFQKYI